MYLILLMSVLLTKLTSKDLSITCKCELLSKGDCDIISATSECFWDLDQKMCRPKKCPEYSSQESCKERKDCYWAGNTTKCLNNPLLCSQFTFDYDNVYLCNQIGCNYTNYNVCRDKIDCREFHDENECQRQGCHYNGEICLKDKCSNYRPDTCIEKSTKCIMVNKVCRDRSCSDLNQGKCDGSTVGKQVCHFTKSGCTELASNAECSVIGSQKACLRHQGGCKWNGTACFDKQCSDLVPSKCKNTQAFMLGNQQKLCEQKLQLLNLTKYCDESKGEKLNETNCITNSERTYFWSQKSPKDSGSCLPCTIQLIDYNIEMHANLIAFSTILVMMSLI